MTTALILGAAMRQDGPSPALARRAEHAAGLYLAGQVDHLVACGGCVTFPPTEAEAIRTILLAKGVPDTAITLEDKSVDTVQNFRFAKPLVSGPVIVVTDRLHMPRAMRTARAVGIKARPAPVPHRLKPRLVLREVGANILYLWKLRGIR
ncbi:YdcF family protein [Marivivens aquimaris]|uniref:YdcF family protein n=1 Tax=Marivivens aquimaris TaxID=2774876 RepID=UPI00187EE4D5|nr:YdcF family protein [Marivivens aquimaris]